MDFEDYYEILGISWQATLEEIRSAYQDQCFILHPDRMRGTRASAQKRAEEQLKRVNQAYEVLKDAQKRQQYDYDWNNKTARPQPNSVPKPKPTVDPPYIRFDDVEAGEIMRASFVIHNVGGPFSEIWFIPPDSWVRVVCWAPLSNTDKLPLEMEIEAVGEEYGKTYTESITVKLDDEETQVRIELCTKSQPTGAKTQTSASPGAAAVTRSGIFPFPWGWQIAGLSVSMLLGIILIALSFQPEYRTNFSQLFFFGTGLLSFSGYCGFRTKWLTAASAAPLGVKIGAGTSIICGLVAMGAVALYIALIVAAVVLGFFVLILFLKCIFTDGN